MNEPHQFTWNGIDLEGQRQIMDPPCDDAVTSIFESGSSMGHLTTLLKGMARDDDFVSEELPPAMHDFVQEELNYEFSEEDEALFKKAHKVWKRDGMKFIFILFFRALPYTYMAEKPANVLRMTRLLETQTERRIFETAQFVFDVMDRHWWHPEKRGILTALKVRIMHSAMRHVILESRIRGEEWNPDWGQPISQEDLIATNQVFSLEFFKGMSMLGEDLNKEDQEAWFHTWKTIGRIMGVHDDLICDTVNEAWELQHQVYGHLFKDETHSGILLAERLVEALDHFHMPEHFSLHLMKRMLADEQFPDCFERMLGPTYKNKYPHLFVKPDPEEKDAHHEKLRSEFHKGIKNYHSILKEKKERIKKKAKKGESFITKIWHILKGLVSFLRLRHKDSHIIDLHLDKLDDVLSNEDGEPVEELEEEMIMDIMSLMGGFMVSILAVHFRQGKETGFRIPATLRDNWSLKG